MSKMNSLYVSLLALVAALVALGMCIHCCAQKQSLSVEQTLNNNPEIIINAMQNYEQKMREQAAAEAQKMIEANLPALNNDANTPFIGAADAKTVLVEFFDFSCHYCQSQSGYQNRFQAADFRCADFPVCRQSRFGCQRTGQVL
mgnify:CR=1 FL=1